MTKSSFYWTVTPCVALILLATSGGCTPSTSPDESAGSQPVTTTKQAPQSPPPNVNIGNEKAMDQAAKESADKFAKPKK